MAISYQRNGDGTGTVTIEFTNQVDKIEPFIEDLAEALYGDFEEVPFSALTNQAKLDIIGDKVRTVFVGFVKHIRELRARDAVQTVEL